MALPQPKPLYIGNTMVLELSDDDGALGLVDSLTGLPINDATVTATLKDAAGANIAGQTWPLTLAYVAASSGIYRGTLAPTLAVSDKQALTCVVDVTAGSAKAHSEIPMVGAIRKK